MIRIEFDKKNNKSVAYDENNIVGVCKFIEQDDSWNIVHTEVDKSYQGQGIAKKLVESVIEAAKTYNITLEADCSSANKVIKS